MMEKIGKLGARNEEVHKFLDKLNDGKGNLTLQGTYVSDDMFHFQSDFIRKNFERLYGPDVRRKFGDFSYEIIPELAKYVVTNGRNGENISSINKRAAEYSDANDYFLHKHSGNRIILAGLEGMTDVMIKGRGEGKNLLFNGDNGVGKSHVGKYLIWKLKENDVDASYLSVADVVNWASEGSGYRKHPVLNELGKSKLLVLDELNKIHNVGGGLRSVSSKNLLDIMNKADVLKIPVVMFYTGNKDSLSRMIYDMRKREGDGPKEKTVRDLASRITDRTFGEMKMIPNKEISGFVKAYLESKQDLPLKIRENIDIFTDSIAAKIPSNYDFRQLVGDIDVVLFSAGSYAGLNAPFGVEEVSSLLSCNEQGDIFRGDSSENVLRSVSEYSGVGIADIRKGKQTNENTAARILTAHLLDKKGWEQKDIAEVIGKHRSRVSGILSRADNLLAGKAEKKVDKNLAIFLKGYLKKNNLF